MNLGERNDGATKLREIKQEKERKRKIRQKIGGRKRLKQQRPKAKTL
jgi:hypothetical protein